MSGGKKKSKTTETRQNTLAPWTKQKYEQRTGLIDSMLADNPYKPYEGELVAGLSDREKTARSMFDDVAGSFNPAFDEASGMIRNAGTHADFGDVSDKYMNPFTRDVVDVATGDIERWNEEMNASSMERALANRAYGGSGSAVERAMNNEAAGREAARTSADLNYKGYNDAREYYDRDINNEVQRGGLLADLAGARHQMATGDAFNMNTLGEVDRGIEQDKLGAAYNEDLRGQEDLYRRLGLQMQMVNGIPRLINSTGTTETVEKNNPGLMGAIGAAVDVASMFTPGGAIGGIGGLFSNMMGKAKPITGLHAGPSNAGF